MDLKIEFSPEELAAIDAEVERRRAHDPDITPAALMVKVAKKAASAWAANDATDRVRAATQQFAEAAKKAPAERVAEALAVLARGERALGATREAVV